MKTKEELNRIKAAGEAESIKCAEMSEEELSHVEGGLWSGRRKGTEPGIVPPMSGPPACFSGKGKRKTLSSCPSPVLCPYREDCANNNRNNLSK